MQTKTIKLSVGNDKITVPVPDPPAPKAPVDPVKPADPAPPAPPAPPVTQVPPVDPPKPQTPPATETNVEVVEGMELELDGVTLTVDKDGNAVDKDGKVVKTKADLLTIIAANQEGEEDDEIPTIEAIQSVNNLVITDDKGQPIKYENTVEGFASYTNDVVELGKQLGVKEYEEQLFGTFPILRDVLEHLQLNGTLDNFNNEIDYTNVQLDKNNQAQLINIISAARQAKGDTPEEIQDYIEAIKTKGTLAAVAESSLTYLNSTKSKRDNERRQAIEAKQAEEAREEKAYWDSVNNVLKARKLTVGNESITIPEVIRINDGGKIIVRTPNDFKDYIETEKIFIVDGKRAIMTQHQYDLMIENSKRTVNDDIYEAYRRFTKYDDSQIIRAKSNTQIAKAVLKLSSNKATTGGGVKKSTGKTLVTPVK